MNNSTPLRQAAPQRIRKSVSLDAKKAKLGWIFVLPFVLGLLFIYIPVIFDSLKYSFNELKMLQGGGFELKFVGIENYVTALSDGAFKGVLSSGIRQILFDIPAIVIFGLFIAVVLNGKVVGRAAFRAILFLPVIMETGLIAQIDAGNALLDFMGSSNSISTGEVGATTTAEIVSAADLSWLFSSMKVGSEIVQYVTGIVNNIYDIINRSGVQMLIFLAGLQSISPAIYESCQIDGASGWETFWKITIPMISPMILVNTVYTVIDAFTSSTNKVMTYISGVYDTAGGQVLSSAMSWIYFAEVMGIIAIVTAALSAFVFYQRRD